MFSSGSFAPLYAEEYLDIGPPGQTSPRRQQQQYYSGAHSPRAAEYGYSDAEQPTKSLSSKPYTPRSSTGNNNFRRDSSKNSDDTPTSETSSDDDLPMEGPFEDEPYVRRMSSSATSFRQRSSPTMQPVVRSSASVGSPRRAFTPSRQTAVQPISSSASVGTPRSSTSRHIPSPPPLKPVSAKTTTATDAELASRDKRIRKLTSKLDKMQRRVVNLEVDLQCQDMKFTKHTTEEMDTIRQMEGGKVDPVGIEIGGPPSEVQESSSATSSTSQEEKQEDPPVQCNTHHHKSSIGPEARRLINKLLNDYEDMERLYKEERYQHARHMRNVSLRKLDGGAVVAGGGTDAKSHVSACIDPAWDNHNHHQSPAAVFEPQLQDGMRASYMSHPPIPRTVSGLSGTGGGGSLAPDPPEEVMAPRYQYQYQHQYNQQHPQFRQFHGHANKEDAYDYDDSISHHSDDLSSKEVNSLIDEDVQSDCKAVKEHQGDGRQYWRDIILGVNDGLVSTFLLVAGVRGGGMSSTEILLTAIAGSVAGAVSMCAGEYVATKSQNEVIAGEIATEERHIRDHRRAELTEVSDLLELIGIGDRSLQKRLIRHYARDPKALLKIMIALELGFLEEEERSPAMAGFVSFFLFLIGAVPSVIPFMIPNIDPNTGFIAAGVATCITLLIVGAVKTWATKGNCLTAALENLCVAGFGGAVAFGAGHLSTKLIGS